MNWLSTYIKPVMIQPPSYGGPHHAIDTRSAPCDMHGRPLGGSGMLSTATEAAATSQLCRFITSTVYFPLWLACIFVRSNIDEPFPTFIWMFSLSVNSWPYYVQLTYTICWKRWYEKDLVTCLLGKICTPIKKKTSSSLIHSFIHANRIQCNYVLLANFEANNLFVTLLVCRAGFLAIERIKALKFI